MAYPKHYQNSQTSKNFTLTLEDITNPFVGHMIKAKENGFFIFSEAQWGSVKFELEEEGELNLHTIESHPEKGTGLGSLLMFLCAKYGEKKRCTKVNILSAAISERDFYYKMGCKLDQSSLKGIDVSDLSQGQIERLTSSCPVIGTPESIRASAAISLHKRWKAI